MKPDNQPESSANKSTVMSGGFRGKLTRRRNKVIFIVVLAVVLALIGLASYVTYKQLNPSVKKVSTAPSPAYQQLQRLNGSTPPADAVKQAIYYETQQSLYDGVGDYKSAIAAGLKAQELVEKNNIESTTVYLALANDYKQLGDKTKAAEYYQKQIDRLKAAKNASENAKAIQYAQKLKDEL